MKYFLSRESVHERSLRWKPAVTENGRQRCVRLIVNPPRAGDGMSTFDGGTGTDALKIGAAVTVLAAEVIAAVVLLIVIVG